VPKWLFAAACLATVIALQSPGRARAIPLFARQYGVTCEKCHSVIPHLNAFGAAFLAYGYRIPGVEPGPAFPISAKINLVYSSERQGSGPNGSGLSKAIVDEIEAFASGAIGSRASYFVEQYAVDGGEPGLLRDAWVIDRVNPWNARIPVYMQGGSFTLPLPVDPETFRDTYQGYTPLVQTVGANPFNFFDPRLGMRFGIGDPLHGPSLQLFAGPGYDRQSGLAKTGVDTMEEVQDGIGPVTLSLYHYQGTRLLRGGTIDEFYRLGYGLTYDQWGRFSSETVMQTGWDSNCAALGTEGCASSGGFEQLRYAFDTRLYVEARYEGTQDPAGFSRDAILLAGFAPTESSRITIEDVLQGPSRVTHTMNTQLTVAF
jgi:hypothetical protein